jgi:hypothetical protein
MTLDERLYPLAGSTGKPATKQQVGEISRWVGFAELAGSWRRESEGGVRMTPAIAAKLQEAMENARPKVGDTINIVRPRSFEPVAGSDEDRKRIAALEAAEAFSKSRAQVEAVIVDSGRRLASLLAQGTLMGPTMSVAEAVREVRAWVDDIGIRPEQLAELIPQLGGLDRAGIERLRETTLAARSIIDSKQQMARSLEAAERWFAERPFDPDDARTYRSRLPPDGVVVPEGRTGMPIYTFGSAVGRPWENEVDLDEEYVQGVKARGSLAGRWSDEISNVVDFAAPRRARRRIALDDDE